MEGFSFQGVAVGPDEQRVKIVGAFAPIARMIVAICMSLMDVVAIITIA
jgi:hypothetical protein